MTEETDSSAPKRTKRASNRIGLEETDEDGTVWLSSGIEYSIQGAVPSEEKEDS